MARFPKEAGLLLSGRGRCTDALNITATWLLENSQAKFRKYRQQMVENISHDRFEVLCFVNESRVPHLVPFLFIATRLTSSSKPCTLENMF